MSQNHLLWMRSLASTEAAQPPHALRTLTWRFSARRMLIDYTLGGCLPAAWGMTSLTGVDVRLLTESFALPHFARQPWLEQLKK